MLNEILLIAIAAAPEQELDLEAFYHEHKSSYFNYIKKVTGDHHHAEDILHNAFLKIISNIHKLRHKEKARAWGFQIVANTCRNYFRKSDNKKVSPEADMSHVVYNEIFLKENTKSEKETITKVINGLLAELDRESREVFILKHYENLNYEEIAEILKTSKRTVRRRMKQALTVVTGSLEKMRVVKGKNFTFRRESYE